MNTHAVRAEALLIVRGWIRSPATILANMMVPLALLLMLFAMNQPAAIPEQVFVVDEAQNAESGALLHAIGVLADVSVLTDRAELQARLDLGDLAAGFVIPADYGGASASIDIVGDAAAARRATALLVAAEGHLANPTDGASVLPGIISLNIMAVSLTGSFMAAVQLRHGGLLERLAVSPLRKHEWLLGRMAGQAVIALSTTAFLLAVAWFALGLRAHVDLTTILVALLGTAMFSAIGTILGGRIQNIETGALAINIVYLPMALLSGSFFSVDVLPTWIRWASRFSPLTYLNEALRLDLIGAPAVDLVFHGGLLLAITIVLVLLGTRTTRWTRE